MAFPKLEYTRLWTRDSDFAKYVDSETQVREDLQYHPDAIATYINDVLLPAMQGTEGAANIGDTYSGTVAGTIRQIKSELEEQAEAIVNLSLGDSPESIRSATVTFEKNDWARPEAGKPYELCVPRYIHKRADSGFGYKLQMFLGGVYVTNTWGTAGTGVNYDEANGDIILTSETQYDGAAVFFGI